MLWKKFLSAGLRIQFRLVSLLDIVGEGSLPRVGVHGQSCEHCLSVWQVGHQELPQRLLEKATEPPLEKHALWCRHQCKELCSCSYLCLLLRTGCRGSSVTLKGHQSFLHFLAGASGVAGYSREYPKRPTCTVGQCIHHNKAEEGEQVVDSEGNAQTNLGQTLCVENGRYAEICLPSL